MQFKTKLLTAVVATTFSLTSFAATETFSGAFTTIKDVTISEITPLNLVGLELDNNSQCILAASTDGTGQGYVGDVAMNLGNTSNGNAAGDDVATMTGTGCLGTATGGQMGIYEIDGALGSSVKITIVDGSNADLSIVPAGCAGNYNGGVDGDTCVAVSQTASPVTVVLANAADTSTLGEGTPVGGKTRIALGGTAVSQQDLLAGTSYTVDFEINVVY